MFYLRSGQYNDSEQRVLIWVCDSDNKITVCFGEFNSYDNIALDELDGKTIETLEEIQSYVTNMDCTWDEEFWDVYDDELNYVESRRTLIE